MANTLKIERKAQVVSFRSEGSSIRSIERITGIHRDTIMRLGVRIGEGCKRIMDDKLRSLNCKNIQVDGVIRTKGKPNMSLHLKSHQSNRP